MLPLRISGFDVAGKRHAAVEEAYAIEIGSDVVALAGGEIVENVNTEIPSQKPGDQMRADEARAAGDQACFHECPP